MSKNTTRDNNDPGNNDPGSNDPELGDDALFQRDADRDRASPRPGGWSNCSVIRNARTRSSM